LNRFLYQTWRQAVDSNAHSEPSIDKPLAKPENEENKVGFWQAFGFNT